MVGQINIVTANGLKEKKIAISLRAIFKGKITSLKSYAKSYPKLKTISWRQRPQEEKGFPRYAHCSLAKRIKETWRRLIGKKIRRKVHDIP